MNLTSEQKGKLFEDWMKNHLFPSKYFDLIDVPLPYEVGKDRYVESIKNPDFKFRCKKSGRLFWVEAKYRKGFNIEDNKLYWASNPNQLIKYNHQNSKGIPVFIAIGYEGTPDNPANVSFFHINDLKYEGLYKTTLKEFDVKNTPFTDASFIDRIPKTKANTFSPVTRVKEKSLKKYLWGIPVLVLIFASPIFYYLNSNKSFQNKIVRDKIHNYYAAAQQENINVDEYFAPNVLQFITEHNLTPDDIKKSIAKDKNEFQNQHFTLKEDDILLDRKEGGIRYYSFWIHYTCYRTSMRKTEDCDVNVEIGVNNSYKFIFYKEMKIENLKFY